MTSRRLPECWGHRGASARFPENTLASFEAAIRDGAEGLESDVHVSTDQVIVMFHDPTLERTTDGTGAIKKRNYYGPDGMEHCRTRKEPKQPIPTFVETIALLMQPDNRHVKFNIDVKVNNEPHQLFALMRTALSAHPNWEVDLAPRLLIGIWHPSFIAPCKEYLPHCRRSFIGTDINVARRYFWSDVDAFSVLFYSLSRSDGQAFIKECQAAKKQLCVWTVNNPDMMMEAVKWKVDAILTDRTQAWLDLRIALRDNYSGLLAKQDRTFLWTRYEFWLPFHFARISLTRKYLEMIGGPFNAAEQRGVLERWAESLGVAFGELIMKYFPPRS